MSNIPSNIRVAGIDYTVEFPSFIEINGNRNYQGCANYHDAKLQVLDDLSKHKQEQVFVHELLHAIYNEAGFDDQDEDMINRVGIVLYQVLKDNKLYFGE